jgi:hypothetical protein
MRICVRIRPHACIKDRERGALLTVSGLWGRASMSNNTTRPSSDTASQFTSDFAKAVTALEAAVFDLMSGSWEETSRRRAYDMAVALRQAARGAGWQETEDALRALESLLALSPQVVVSIQRPIGDKMLEFLRLLKGGRVTRNASGA